MNPLAIQPPPPAAIAGSSQSATPGADPIMDGPRGSFAELFEQIHPLHTQDLSSVKPPLADPVATNERQDFAAQEGLPDSEQALVAWAISPQLEVIKPDNDGPDGESVLAFAKSQGLSAEVLSWLFKPASTSNTSIEQHATDTQFEGLASDALSGVSPAQKARAASGLTHTEGPYPSIEPTLAAMPPSLAVSTPAPPSADDAVSNGSALARSASRTNLSVSVADLLIQPSLAVSTLAPPSADDAVSNGSALARSASRTNLSGSVADPLIQPSVQSALPSITSGSPKPAATLEGGLAAAPATPARAGAPAMAVVSALSILALSEAKALSTEAGSSSAGVPSPDAQPLLAPLAKPLGPSVRSLVQQATQKSSASSTGLARQAAEILTLTVDLEVDPSERRNRDKPSDAPSHQPSSTPGAASSTSGHLPLARLGVSQSGAATNSTLITGWSSAGADKAADLSDKMGQAVGERMLQALDRGQWSIKLMLKPAHLGHIEVDMRMRNGELDASFLASHAGTRDLLQAGLGSLKLSLTSSGMDVASMSVADYQSRSSGGESTPKRARPSATERKIEADTEKSAVAQPGGIARSGAAGLDVLV